MKVKELIELLRRVDGDTKIVVCGKCGFTNPVTLWDWTDTHGAVVLAEIEKQDCGYESTVCGGNRNESEG